MLSTISTAVDIEHVLHPFDKDVTGCKAWLNKGAGGTVLIVGGLATLGLLPLFYLYTSYQKTHYWEHAADRLETIKHLEKSMLPNDAKKAKLSGERILIRQHLLKQIAEQLSTLSFEEMKGQIEGSHFDPLTKNKKGETLFHIAAQYKSFNPSRDNTDEIIKLLEYLEEKTPKYLNEKNRQGLTPLFLAIENNSEKIVLALLKNPNLNVNETNSNYLTPFQYLIQTSPANATEMIKGLMNHPSFDVAANCKQPPKYPSLLSAACRHRKTDHILLLLSIPGSDLINQPNPDFVPVIKELLYYFERVPNEEAIALLAKKTGIEYEENEDNNGSLVHYAIKFGKYECAKSLLTQPNADINVLNKWGRTPLDHAPKGSDFEQFLISKGARKTIAS